MTVRTIPLEPHPGSRERAGTLVWDDESGTIYGDDDFAERVRFLVSMAEQRGLQPAHPIPFSVDIIDPLRELGEMAAILGWHWRLPEWLNEHYPKVAPDEDGGEDSDVPYADVNY